MGDLLETSGAFDWSISKIARGFGMSRETVAKRIQDACLEPTGKRNGYPVYPLDQIGPALFGRAHAAGPAAAPDRMIPKDRLDHYRAERERLKLEAEQRTLLNASEVSAAISKLLKALAQQMEVLPAQMEHDYGLSARETERLHAAMDAARDTLYLSAMESLGVRPETV